MNTEMDHEYYMKRCFDLAGMGLGRVAPNPMVGSVIVHNHRIIGEGYHHQFGQVHAEVNAVKSVKDKELLKQATLYVNLEPCSHYGKTPPCSDLIIEHEIPRVVISTIDPNVKVRGRGVERLKSASVEVLTNVLNEEGMRLNKRFFTYHHRSRPYIILKWAQTGDGFIDIIRDPAHPQQPNWITDEEARMLVHKWRAEEQAILVGTNTAFLDNPRLNVRSWPGNHPIRVVLDRTLRLPNNLNLFDGSVPTLVFTCSESEDPEIPNTDYIVIPNDEYIPEHILGELYRRQILSVIIEGGSKLIQSFVEGNLWDEARVFTGKKYFREGIPAPLLPHKPSLTEHWEKFKLDVFYNS